jgi:23S rRNA pseudouridine1911/1915/1917 synthase
MPSSAIYSLRCPWRKLLRTTEFLLLFFFSSSCSFSWTGCLNHNRQQSQCSRRKPYPRTSQQIIREPLILFARSPPISNFDLESIEAFENEIDGNVVLNKETGISILFDDERSVCDDKYEEEEEESFSQNSVLTITVPTEWHGKRIDAIVAALIEPPLSRSVCGNLVAEGRVRQVANQDTAEDLVLNRKAHKVNAGTVLRVEIPIQSVPSDWIVAQDIPLSILYEDEHMIVLNKAAGMVVHPGSGNWDGTVVNALAYYLAYNSTLGSGDFVSEDGTIRDIQIGCGNICNKNSIQNDPTLNTDGEASTVSFRPGIVHRLDKGTTGILVVAKTSQALSKLSEAFAARTVGKTYLTITVGNPGKQVVIDKPIGRHPIHRQRMRVVPDPHRKDSSGMTPHKRHILRATSRSKSTVSQSDSVSQSGRRALSHVDTLAFDGKLGFARIRIETGRTHQIRVHLQDRHTPVYGDDVYGIADWNQRLKSTHGIERPLLHAYRLELRHPITNEPMVFDAPMAQDMIGIAKTIWPDGPDKLPSAFDIFDPKG